MELSATSFSQYGITNVLYRPEARTVTGSHSLESATSSSLHLFISPLLFLRLNVTSSPQNFLNTSPFPLALAFASGACFP